MDEDKGPLEEPAGEWFVNRRVELARFWKWATGIPHPGRNSYALIGLRRTGKTAIMHKTFNRLFHEQERVLPVHISFVQYLNRPEPITAYQFAREYFEGYLRSYLAFRHRQPQFHQNNYDLDPLRDFANEVSDEFAQELIQLYDRKVAGGQSVSAVPAHNIMQWVINFPRGYAWTNDIPTAMFVDEFQVLTRVLDPDDGRVRNLTDSFQHAVETRYAPMLVSGSSVSMMMDDAVSGLLSGRFKFTRLGPLSQEHAIDMIFRLGTLNGIDVTEELALALWEWTQGYPYAIESILNSDSPAFEQLPAIDRLDELVLYELTNKGSALWSHYEGEYGKYVKELNGDDITRKVLFWITNHIGEHIHPRNIAELLGLDLIQVRESLEALYKIDIIDRASISTFSGPTDPLLLEFLQHEHYLDVEDLSPVDAEAKLRKQLNAKQGEMNRQTGHFSEIIVAGLLNNYDDREVAGEAYFGSPNQVPLPRMTAIDRREGVIKAGELHEIDVVGEYRLYNRLEGNAGMGAWLISVRYRQETMNEDEVEAFIKHAAALQAEKQYGDITRWYFSKAGFTQAAKRRLQEEGIYYSDLDQFNALASLFGLLSLSM